MMNTITTSMYTVPDIQTYVTMCASPLQDVSEHARVMIELVRALGQRHPLNYVLDVWRGSEAQAVGGVGHAATTCKLC